MHLDRIANLHKHLIAKLESYMNSVGSCPGYISIPIAVYFFLCLTQMFYIFQTKMMDVKSKEPVSFVQQDYEKKRESLNSMCRVSDLAPQLRKVHIEH